MKLRVYLILFLAMALAQPVFFFQEAEASTFMVCRKTFLFSQTTIECEQSWGNVVELVATHGFLQCTGTAPGGPLPPSNGIFILEEFPNNTYNCWIVWANPGTYTLNGTGNYFFYFWNTEDEENPILEVIWYLASSDFDTFTGPLP